MATDEISKDEMLHEAKNMARITKNKHIVNLQGISLHQEKIYLLLEYCALGSVDTYLRKNDLHYIECVENKDYEFLLRCCSQVSEGMVFLVDKGIIHADLAARNVLITSDMNIKVADFGLSTRIYSNMGDSSASGSTGSKAPKYQMIPLRWSSYEILKSKHAVIEFSDVWSFGVYMWEVFQLGRGLPYVGVSDGKTSVSLS